jgi:hypothetical protein
MLFYVSNFSTGLVLAWVTAFAVYDIRDPESIPGWMFPVSLVVLGVAWVDITVSTIVMGRRNRRAGKKATIREAEEAWLHRDHQRVAKLLSPFRNELDWVLMRRLIVSERRCRKDAAKSES